MALISNINDLKIEKYKCGSRRLSHEIQTKLGMVPVDIYVNKKNNKIIKVFIMTPQLSQFLKKWSDNNPNRKEVPINE